jgi:hypothetical protein
MHRIEATDDEGLLCSREDVIVQSWCNSWEFEVMMILYEEEKAWEESERI